MDLFEEVMMLKSGNPELDNAIFDADGTIWQNDVTEAAIARAAEDHPKEYEVDFKHYYSLLDLGKVREAYLFAAQIFQGWSLRELDELARKAFRAEGMVIGTRDLFGKTINRGIAVNKNIITLAGRLQAAGVRCHIVSASLDPFVRAALDFYRIADYFEQVIGIRNKIKDGVMTSELEPPVPIFEDKVKSIKHFVHPKVRPLLVVGDSENDESMLWWGRRAAVINRKKSFVEKARGFRWTILER